MFSELIEALEFKRDTLQAQVGDVSPYVDKLIAKEVTALGARITELEGVVSRAGSLANAQARNDPQFQVPYNRYDKYILVEEPVTLVYRLEKVT